MFINRLAITVILGSFLVTTSNARLRCDNWIGDQQTNDKETTNQTKWFAQISKMANNGTRTVKKKLRIGCKAITTPTIDLKKE